MNSSIFGIWVSLGRIFICLPKNNLHQSTFFWVPILHCFRRSSQSQPSYLTLCRGLLSSLPAKLPEIHDAHVYSSQLVSLTSILL